MADENKQRRGLYAKLAIARKQLPDMDEEAYRSRLRAEFGVDSAAALSVAQLSRLVHDFAREGVVYTAPAKAKNSVVKPQSRTDWIEVTNSMPHAHVKRQICAIWRKLGYGFRSLLFPKIRRALGKMGKIVIAKNGNNYCQKCPKRTPCLTTCKNGHMLEQNSP